MKKVCIFVHTFLKGGGGTATLRAFIEHLVNKPLEVHLVTGPDIDDDILVTGSNIKIKQIRQLKRSINPLDELIVCIQLWRLFKEEQYDLLHTNYAKPGLIGRIIGKLAGVPVILHHIYGCTFNDAYNPVLRFTNAFIERLLSKLTDFYVFVGEDIRKRYGRAGINVKHNTAIVYPAMNFESFVKADNNKEALRLLNREKLGLTENDFAMVLVSRMIPGKGHEEAIELMRRLKEVPEIKLFLIGKGPLKDKIEQMILESGMKDRIIMLGFVKEIAPLMTAFDLGVFTSYGEGVPQVLIQMAILNMPIVTSAVDGANEILKNYKKKVILPIGDTHAMSREIRHLYKQEKGMEAGFGQDCYAITSKWDVEWMRNSLYKVYEKLLHR